MCFDVVHLHIVGQGEAAAERIVVEFAAGEVFLFCFFFFFLFQADGNEVAFYINVEVIFF